MSSSYLQPLHSLDASNVVGVLTDVDDTLTRDGQLCSATYAAMAALKAKGVLVVPVTGRSSGWGHMMMTTWPVDAVVAESGGTYFLRQHERVRMHYFDENRQKRLELLQLCNRLISQEPTFAYAVDNAFRTVDVAIDYNESVDRVPQPLVDRLIAAIKVAGFQARASSIHVNAWYGEFDKAPTALKVIEQLSTDLFRPNLADANNWIFVGDAPNDASMFGVFQKSVAVANIQPYLESSKEQFSALPCYVCKGSFGEGFQELADHILKDISSNKGTSS